MTIIPLLFFLAALLLAFAFRRQWNDALSDLRDEFSQRRIDTRIRQARTRPLGPPRHPTISALAPGRTPDVPADVRANARTSGD